MNMWMLITLLAATPAAQTQVPAGGSCPAALYHALDFWVGTWEVQTPAGAVTARSIVEPVADGCGILERYSGQPGPAGRRYVGSGYHVFDAASGIWRQLWSDNRPAVTVMTGRVADAAVVYEWSVPDAQGRPVPKRYTLSRDGAGVRQLGERSDDGGKTWTTEFDLRYRRA